LYKIHGIGSIPTLKNPKILQAQSTPSLLNIWTVNKGKAAANMYRRRLLAAMAEAALRAW
jgi:hypothetical protein